MCKVCEHYNLVGWPTNESNHQRELDRVRKMDDKETLLNLLSNIRAMRKIILFQLVPWEKLGFSSIDPSKEELLQEFSNLEEEILKKLPEPPEQESFPGLKGQTEKSILEFFDENQDEYDEILYPDSDSEEEE
jgi:hypothetical protein